jgi:hypothetical protein
MRMSLCGRWPTITTGEFLFDTERTVGDSSSLRCNEFANLDRQRLRRRRLFVYTCAAPGSNVGVIGI